MKRMAVNGHPFHMLKTKVSRQNTIHFYQFSLNLRSMHQVIHFYIIQIRNFSDIPNAQNLLPFTD